MMDGFQSLDLALLHAITPWHTPTLDQLMSLMSASGSAGAIWLFMTGIGLIRRRHRAAAWRVLLTIALSYLIVDGVLKPLVARPRPSIEATDPPRHLPPLPRTSSFPSGHAASTFGAAVAVSRMWPQGRVAWWTIAVLIGYSRLYLAHHYPFDVLGGALLGILLALWVLGGRHRATYASTLPRSLPAGTVIRP